MSHALLGWSWAALGAHDHAEHHLRRAMELSPLRGLAGQIGRSALCVVLIQRGEKEEALSVVAAACGAARGSSFMEGAARAARGYVHVLRGELDEAERDVRFALDELASMPLLRSTALAQMALVHAARGRFRQALHAAREGLGAGEPCRAHPFVEIQLRALEIEALTVLGDVTGARAAFARARARLLALAGRIGDEAIRRGFLEQIARNTKILSLVAEDA